MKFSTTKTPPLLNRERLRQCKGCNRVLGNQHYQVSYRRCVQCCHLDKAEARIRRKGKLFDSNLQTRVICEIIRNTPICQVCGVRHAFAIWDRDYCRKWICTGPDSYDEMLSDITRLTSVCEVCLPKNGTPWEPGVNLCQFIGKTKIWPWLAKEIRQARVRLYHDLPEPPPVVATAGSAEKIEVLRWRAEQGLALFSEKDRNGRTRELKRQGQAWGTRTGQATVGAV